jgi:hypothetical protein
MNDFYNNALKSDMSIFISYIVLGYMSGVSAYFYYIVLSGAISKAKQFSYFLSNAFTLFDIL